MSLRQRLSDWNISTKPNSKRPSPSSVPSATAVGLRLRPCSPQTPPSQQGQAWPCGSPSPKQSTGAHPGYLAEHLSEDSLQGWTHPNGGYLQQTLLGAYTAPPFSLLKEPTIVHDPWGMPFREAEPMPSPKERILID